MDTPRSTEEIIENEPIEIPLAGKVYSFAEPGARTCRKQLAKAATVGELVRPAITILHDTIADLSDDELAQLTDEAASAELMASRLPAELLVQLTEATEAMLDFLLETVEAMKGDRDHIENEAADTLEIRNAFDLVCGVLVRPTKRTRHARAAQAGDPQSTEAEAATV